MLLTANISKNDQIENKRKNVRTAELLIMSKKCSKIKFSIILSWDIWNKTVGNENGLGFCSIKGVLYA